MQLLVLKSCRRAEFVGANSIFCSAAPRAQGFSIIGSRVAHDPRNDLFREFMRIGRELRPKVIVIENVPGLATFARGMILSSILDRSR